MAEATANVTLMQGGDPETVIEAKEVGGVLAYDPPPVPDDAAGQRRLIEESYSGDERAAMLRLHDEVSGFDPMTATAGPGGPDPDPAATADPAPAPAAAPAPAPAPATAPDATVPERIRTEAAELAARMIPLREPDAAPAATDADMNAAVESFKAEYGEEAAAPFEALANTNRALAARDAERSGAVTELQNLVLAGAQREKAAELESTLSIIESIPELAKWRDDARALDGGDTSRSDALWNAAVSTEETFAQLPGWQGSDSDTIRRRLEHVAKIVGGEVPAAAPGAVAPAPAPAAVPTPTPAQAAAMVRHAAATVPAATVPDPGGDPACEPTSMEIFQSFEAMTPEQVDAALARLPM